MVRGSIRPRKSPNPNSSMFIVQSLQCLTSIQTPRAPSAKWLQMPHAATDVHHFHCQHSMAWGSGARVSPGWTHWPTIWMTSETKSVQTTHSRPCSEVSHFPLVSVWFHWETGNQRGPEWGLTTTALWHAGHKLSVCRTHWSHTWTVLHDDWRPFKSITFEFFLF